jgi:hypothetical protein
MQLKIALAALILAASFIPAIAGQTATANMTVRGSVGAAALIAPSPTNPLTVQGQLSAHLIPVDRSSIIVRLAGANAGGASRVRVRLLMRTNTGYELRATASGSAAAASVSASIGGAHPTGPAVFPSAAARLWSQTTTVELSAEPAPLARGPRISRGSASSPRNAIEIEVRIEIDSHSSNGWSRDVLLAIAPAEVV